MKVKNASKYRTPPIKRTRDSFVDDVGRDVDYRIDLTEARSSQIRRDKDEVKGANVSIYDIDYSVKAYIENVIQPRVEDNGVFIQVPVIYASSEKWNSMQRNGFLRDRTGKVVAPLISYKRTEISMAQELMKNRVLPVEQYHYLSEKRYSNRTPYDRFSVMNGIRRQREMYMSVVPTYVNVNYELRIWCQYQEQLNYLSELFFHYNGKAFGDKNYFKFMGKFDTISYEDTNAVGQERVVRGTTSLSLRGYIVNREVVGEVLTKRSLTPKKVVFSAEVQLNGETSGWKSPDVYPYEKDSGDSPTL